MAIALGLAGKKRTRKRKKKKKGVELGFTISEVDISLHRLRHGKRVDNSGSADQSMTIEEGKMNSRCACGSGDFFYFLFFHVTSKQSKGWLEPSFFSVSEAFDCQVVSHSKLAVR